MTPFTYRCPNIGLNVQGWVTDEAAKSEATSYEAVTCTFCLRVHLVDPKSGKVLGPGTTDPVMR